MKKARYPFSFLDYRCPKCNEEDAIRMVDNNGNLCRNPIYPISHFYCTKCNRDFRIRWLKIEADTIPVVASEVEFDELQDTIVRYALSNRRALI